MSTTKHIINWFSGTHNQLVKLLKSNKPPEATIEAVPSSLTILELKALTVLELKAIAKLRGLKGYSSLKKDELIILLQG